MNLKELLQLAKEAEPEKFNDIPDQKAINLLRVVFGQLKQQIQTATDEPVILYGFGRFKVHRIEKDQDGQKVVRQRINFNPAVPKNPPHPG